MSRRKLIIVGATLLLGIVAGIFAIRRDDIPCAPRCSVIVIVVDTLGAKHMQTYGYLRETMPRTARFFENGVVFDQAYAAAPWTLPSFSSIYFSDLPHRITYTDLEGNRPNLINTLRSAGYAIQGILVPKILFITDAIAKPFGADEAIFGTTPLATARETLPKLIGDETPFLLWIHTFEVHDPYQPGEEYKKLFEKIPGYERVTMDDLLRANATSSDPSRDHAYELRYDQGIAAADDRIADFLESIPEATLKDTVIIFTADHGEAFGEHGKVWHANGLYEEELRVPLLMRIPGVRAKRVARPVSLVDLAPTILSLAKVPIPAEFKGKDLTPLIRGRYMRERPVEFVNGFPFFLSNVKLEPGLVPPVSLKAAGAESADKPIIDPTAFGVRLGPWKLFSQKEKSAAALHLFSIPDDPGETNDLASTALSRIPKTLLERLLLLPDHKR